MRGNTARQGAEDVATFETGNHSALAMALDAFQPQLIYISAGFDAHREDDMGNLGFVEADYAWVTQQLMTVAKEHSKGRIVSCLEGGYVMSPLARSVAAHVKVLIGAD